MTADLTADLLKDIRARHSYHVKRKGVERCGVDDFAWPCDAAVLLATLDAARPSDDLTERQQIERDARLQDALDALAMAVLMVNGTWDASEQAKESLRRKARSGTVGLTAALARLEPGEGEK